MSVRAHPIKKINYGREIFNLWHDEYFRNLLDRKGILDQLNIDGYGILEISKYDLDEIENDIEADVRENSDINPEEVKRAKEIINDIRKEMRKRKDDYLSFYCF